MLDEQRGRNILNLREYINKYCEEEEISIKVSSKMPEGYEDAFGTFDVILNTLFINEKIIGDYPEYEQLFYIFHELRHASQYIHPEKFSKEIQKSRFYVILYNGTCFRLFENEWKECKINESEDYIRKLYINLPYEKDANMFAYRKVREIVGNSKELNELYAFWLPECNLEITDYEKIFKIIDENCK